MANTTKFVSFDKLGLYHEKEVARVNGLINTAKTGAVTEANAYADSLASNYDAAGAASTVQGKLDEEVTRAKAREDEIAGLVATAQGEVDALEGVVATKAAQSDLDALAGKVGTVPEGSTVMGIIGQIQESAYDDTQLRADMATELAKKADKTQVATDIETAVNAEKSARETAVAGVQNAVDTLAGTHATDKTALEGAIALKADITALNAVSDVANAAVKQSDYDVKVKALEDEDVRIVGLVEAEATKAREEEGKLDARLVEVETFFKTAEGETIDQAMDTLVEIQKYITEDGEAADQMVKDIAANKKAIEDHAALNHDFAAADDAVKEELNAEIAKKADKTTVEGIDGRLGTAEGKITTVEGKVSTLEGQMTTVQGAVATKAEAQALTDAVAALEGADTGLGNRIAALEAKHGDGEGTVESLIATAKQEAIDAAAGDATQKANKALEDAKSYTDDEIDKVEGTITTLQGVVDAKAAQSDLTALGNRVTAEEGKVSTLQTEMDAVEALAAANEAAIKALQTASANYALKSEVTAVSDRVTTLETWHNNFVECSQEDINGLFA